MIKIYRVNGFDSVEIEVDASTMEIQSGKLALEEHLGKIGQKLADCTVDTLVAAGVLYKSFEKTIKKAKNKYYKNIMVTSFMCDICKEFETDSEEAILKHKRIDHSVVCPIKAEKTLDGLCPHCGEVILIFICFVHPIFRFWFLVTFGDKVMKIQKYYVIFVCILQGKMGRTEKKQEKKSRN